MADIDYSDLENMVISIESEDGETIECELVCIFEYDEQDYAAFTEVNSEDNEVYLFTVNAKTKKKETEFEFGIIEDEDLLAELIGVLQQVTDMELEGEEDIIVDADTDEDEEDDDGKWDEFITKKLV